MHVRDITLSCVESGVSSSRSLNRVFNTSAKLSDPNDSLSSYVKNFQLKVDSAKSGFRFKLCFDEIRQVS